MTGKKYCFAKVVGINWISTININYLNSIDNETKGNNTDFDEEELLENDQEEDEEKEENKEEDEQEEEEEETNIEDLTLSKEHMYL